MRSRRNWQFIACGALGLFGVVLALWITSRDNMPSVVNLEEGRASAEERTVTAVAFTASISKETHNRPEAPQFTKSEEEQLLHAENAVFQVVKNIERENASVIMDRALKKGWMVAIAISAPSVEQIGEVSAVIGKQLSAFASRPELEYEARQRLERIYFGALIFRMDHRTVYFTSTEASEEPCIMEVNSDSVEAVHPSEDGRFTFNGPHTIVSYTPEAADEKLGSWSERYGHFVEAGGRLLGHRVERPNANP